MTDSSIRFSVVDRNGSEVYFRAWSHQQVKQAHRQYCVRHLLSTDTISFLHNGKPVVLEETFAEQGIVDGAILTAVSK